MKKCSNVLTMAALATLCFTGCSKAPDEVVAETPKTPEEVVVKFFEGFCDGNMEKIDGYATEQTMKECREMFDEIANKGRSAQEELGLEIVKVIDTKIDGDKATVKFEYKKGSGFQKTDDVILVKVNGKWKVSMEETKAAGK